MAGNRRLTIEILGDARGLAGAFGEADGAVSKFARGIGGAAKTAGLAVAGIAGAAVLAAPKVLEMGTQLDALGKKASTVFGSSLSDVEAWAEATAGSMGLTADQAVGVAAGLGDLLKPMGFTAEQAAEMSTEMLDLSGALSAWTGGTIDAAGVSDILTKAMLGERDGLKQLGISISEADVQARLAAKGQDKLTGAALEQAKALATQELILEKSTDAQTAWEDGTMDAIKAQNEAKASIDEVKEGLVKALFPALQAAVPYVAQAAQWLGDNLPGAMAVAQQFVEDKLVPAFEDYLIPAFQAVAGWVQQHWPQISAAITEAVDTIQSVIEGAIDVILAVWERFGDDILGFVEAVWPDIQQAIGGALDVIRGVFSAFSALLKGDWGALWDAVKQIFTGAWNLVKGAVDIALDGLKSAFGAAWDVVKTLTGDAVMAILGAIGSIPGALLDLAGSFLSAAAALGTAILDGIKGALSSTAGFAGDVASAVLSAVRGVINSYVIDPINSALEFTIPVPGLPDIHINPPDIPRLALGGIVTRPTLALVGEAGPEAVIPLSKASRHMAGLDGGGGPIYLTVEVGGAAIARTVIDQLNRMGGGPLRVRAAGI